MTPLPPYRQRHKTHRTDADMFRGNEENKNSELSAGQKQVKLGGREMRMPCFYASLFSSQIPLDILHFWFEDWRRKRYVLLTSARPLDDLANPFTAYLICKLGIVKRDSLHPSEIPGGGLGALFRLYFLYLKLIKPNM